VAKAGKGETRYASGPEDIVSELEVILDRAAGKSADIVVCIDTTDSMQDDIDMVRAMVPDMLRKKLAEFSSYRLGLLVYRDYFEEYLYKRFDFTPDFGVFLAELGTVRVAGGRDLPEAVYEALYGALTEYAWKAEKKMVILIGDAPPHPLPRGKIDKSMVEEASARLGVEMNVIILPD
jgi:Mg-chelatase subunit ChlD